jgi:hypothetical protein
VLLSVMLTTVPTAFNDNADLELDEAREVVQCSYILPCIRCTYVVLAGSIVQLPSYPWTTM